MRDRQLYWLRAVGLWLVLMGAETLQGLWRVKVVAAWVGGEFARDVDVFTGSLIILLITFAFIDWIPARDAGTLLAVGATWVALTIVYEVALGRFGFGRSWSEVAANFDLSRARMLPLGLLFLFFSPLFAAWIRGRIGIAKRTPEAAKYDTRHRRA